MFPDNVVPEDVKTAFSEAKKYFPTPLQEFQLYDKYARFNYDKKRRETWIETVTRTVTYLKKLSKNKLAPEIYNKIQHFILNMKSAPSMRLLAMAGPAAERNNIAIYNCSYLPMDSIDSLYEELLIAMAGCGVGYSVEKQYVDKFPLVKKQTGKKEPLFVIEDSTEGWANAFKKGLETWFDGGDIDFDYSLIRRAGTPLKIKGGRASGPGPVRAVLDFTKKIILSKQEQKLSPLNVHDICCKVGESIVAGGVRRCLPGYTRIHTKKGSIPIQEVEVGDMVMTDGGYKKVIDWVYQGKQQLVEINTESGTMFKCTPNHRIAVLKDVFGGYIFKRADELNSTDRLLFITQAIDGEEQQLVSLPEKKIADHSGSIIKQPVLDEKTAWILGKFFADGYVQITKHTAIGKKGNTQVSFSCHINEIDQIQRIKEWFVSILIIPQTVKTKGNRVVIRSSNRQLARWFVQYKQAKQPLIIPTCIWKSKKTIRASFLAGVIDGDGCYTNRPFRVVSTVYKQFGYDLIKLLATLGIIAEFHISRKSKGKWQTLYRVNIKNDKSLQIFRDIIASYPIHERERHFGYTIPKEFAVRDIKNQDYRKKWDTKSDMNSSTCSDITGKEGFIPVKIKSVVLLDTQENTYDITVADQHVFVAEGYLVHNTALISLFDIDDEDMRNCKNGSLIGNQQRWMSNNSAVWNEELPQNKILDQMYEMFRGQRGEPGIFSRFNANKIKPTRRKEAVYGSNPCFVSGTLIHTKQGHFPIEELIGKTVDVWDNKQWVTVDNFRVTGDNQSILKITFQDGGETRLTPYHTCITEDGRRIEAKDLKVGDKLRISTAPESHGIIQENAAYIKGFLMADGTHYKENPILYLYDTKYSCEQRLIESAQEIGGGQKNTNAIKMLGFVNGGHENRKRMTGLSVRKELLAWTTKYKKRLPGGVFIWNKESKLELIAGIMDADGEASDTKNGWMYQIWSINKGWLLDFQLLLKTVGVFSRLSFGKAAGKIDFSDGYGEYESQETWRLTISQKAAIILSKQVSFSRLVSFSEKQTIHTIIPRRNKIISIVADGIEKQVYCCTVSDTHALSLTDGLLYGQCGEINLRPYEFCNLSVAIARYDDTLKTLAEKVEVASIIGTIQSMATHFPGLRPIWKKNCEEERLLGVDINGWVDTPLLEPKNPKLAENLQYLRKIAIETNKKYAAILGINQSAAVTCVKPSGNSALLFNCSSGIHPRHYRYYIRNVRVQTESPLKKLLENAGVPMDPENGQTKETANTWVVHFPIRSPEHTITKREMPAIEQCEYWLVAKLNWTEHNPSVTITYTPNEIINLIKWVDDHKKYIGGMSFLPLDDAQYDQMPYESITREEFEDKMKKFPTIDYSQLYLLEKSDFTNVSQELACVSGVCSLDEHMAKEAAKKMNLI